MNVRLSDLAACFEGVIPSIIATASADGTPNISYLSHVVRIDHEHVALSNQFFAKTAANIRANPYVTLILVDCFTGDQYLLDIRFVRSVDSGRLFDKISRQLTASSAQIGMADVMRLRSADVFRVVGVEKVPSPVDTGSAAPARRSVSLPALAEATRDIDRQVDVEEVIKSLFRSLESVLDCRNAVVLILDAHRDRLITIASSGYEQSGLGSEVAREEGLIGAAAASKRTIKISDMSRVRRFGKAIAADAEAAENATRTVTFPKLAAAMSQIAVPLLVQDEVIGVLFAESAERMAFREEDEAALEILAGLAARTIKASEGIAADAEPAQAPAGGGAITSGRDVHVTHHPFDDSVFVDGTYIVKGIAGALLRMMLDWHLKDGRDQFSNRELRLALASRMPEFKDNLETRLLLLRRRLEEKKAPIQIQRTGRGRFRMDAAGPLKLVAAPD